MDNRLSRSMPVLLSPCFISPVTYRVIHPRWPERRHQPRHFYVGGVRTKLIGANSYPNPSRSPQRLVLCGASGGSYEKLTRCSSTMELSHTGVFCSNEDLRDQKRPRRAVSCEDVCRGTNTSAAWDSRFSESGVSLNDSRTDLGSFAGMEDVDGVSQCSFGSSSAFHEITCDSELDRPDSDCLSVPGSLSGQDRTLDVVHEGDPHSRHGDRPHGASRKHRHDSGSREKFLSELTASSSGRSSPTEDRKEFYHSTPTKRGSPVLSIFPADEEDLHFPSRIDKEPLRDLPRDSLPASSPRSSPQRAEKKAKTEAAHRSTESIPSSVDTVREVLKRSRHEFFSSLQDCSKLEEQTAGESVQSWLTTGHTQRHAVLTDSPSVTCEAKSSDQLEQREQSHPHQRQQQPSPQSPPSNARLSVRERVRLFEQRQGSQINKPDSGNSESLAKDSGLQAGSCSGENDGLSGAETSLAPSLTAAGAEVGGAARFSSRQLENQTASETASQRRSGERGTERGGGYKLSHSSGGDGEKNSSLSSPSPFVVDSPSREEDVKNSARDVSEESRNHSGGWNRAETALTARGSIDVDDSRATQPTAQLTGTEAYRAAVSGVVDTVPGDGVNDDNSARSRRYSANTDRKIESAGFAKDREIKAAGFADSEPDTGSYYTVTGEDAEGYRASLVSSESDVNNRESDSWLQRGDKEEEAAREERRTRSDRNADHTSGVASAHVSTALRDKSGHDSATSRSTQSVDNRAPTAPFPTTDTVLSLATLPSFTDADQQVGCMRLQGVANTHPSATMSTEQTSGFQRHGKTAAATEAVTGTDRCPEAQFVDRSEQHMPSSSSVNFREVSRRHTRHVHRTTVQEIVTTTHRTVRHGAGSPTAPRVAGEGYANRSHGEGVGSLRCDTADFVTDETVSTTVREEDSEREETSTSFTQQPPSRSDTDGRSGEWREHRHPHSHASAGSTTSNNESVAPAGDAAAAAAHLYTPSQSATRQRHDDRKHGEGESGRVMAGSGHDTSARYNLLDSLQEQLSLLSSEDVSFTTGAQSPRPFGQASEYTDHAEASLPLTSGYVPPVHSDADDKSDRVRGTGTVFITLERRGGGGGVSGSTFTTSDTRENSAADWKTDHLPGHGSATSGSRRETALRHARVSQTLSTSWGEALSSDEGEGRDGERGKSGAPLHSSPLRAQAVSWRPPASSSSELDDSDGNYSSVSTAESSRPQHGHSESDLPASECGAEDYDNVHSFHDFVSGLQGQSTSDQPSLHHSVDIVSTEFRASLLRSPFIQETILEADDESETVDELDTTDTTVSSFRSSLHFSLPQSTPNFQAVSPVPQIMLWSTDQHVSNLSAASDDGTRSAVSPVHPLQELSDRLSSVGDVSWDSHGHSLHDSRSHHHHHHHDDLDLSGSRHSACSSPAPSDVSEGSAYSASATAEVRKQTELGAPFKSAEPTPTLRLARRNLSSALETSRKSQWVREKALLFQRLLNDFEWQSRTSEQKLLDEMCSLETHGRGGVRGEEDEGFVEKQSEACDELYHAFTRDYLEKRQNHVCPFIEDHLPVFRFRRFLRKKHNSKLKGRRTFRIRHRLGRLMEFPLSGESGVKSVSDADLSRIRPTRYQYQSQPRHVPTSPSMKLKDRLASDVFTDDADVKRSFSDSAYSTLSDVTSRHVSDLDSTMRSVCTSRGDVSSVATDLSMDSDKLTSLSDVFDQLDLCEGEIDQALLDRLRVGHYKADTL